jgi:hypothetical protein
MLNPKYAMLVKQDIDKLLTDMFIKYVKEVKWLSPIVVVPKENGKLRICINFKKLNATTNKDPYPLPFTNEMLNIVVGYETYSFLDGYSGYHQISIAPKDIYNTTFVID